MWDMRERERSVRDKKKEREQDGETEKGEESKTRVKEFIEI